MSSEKQVTLTLKDLRLHAYGVFSNVYRGALISPTPQREVAIKKTWRSARVRNFETIFLSGVGRPRHKSIIKVLYIWENRYEEEVDGKNTVKICESFVFPFSTCTLNALIRLKPMDITDIRIYTWQLFDGLRYLHDRRIAHRDIKPANLLMDPGGGRLTISDFGSAKFISTSHASVTYQVSRFYRPPEILFGSAYYSTAIDVWSAGCVIGEMIRGSVLFQGRDTNHQMKLIFSAFGLPSQDEVRSWLSPTTLNPGTYKGKPTGLAFLIPRAKPEWLEFLGKILVYRPKERLCGRQLLNDKFFDPIFQKGAHRSNGMLISSIITENDRATARIPLEKKDRRIYERLVKKLQNDYHEAVKEKEKHVTPVVEHENTKTAKEELDEEHKKEAVYLHANHNKQSFSQPNAFLPKTSQNIVE
ncbi:hypothetical protein WR25_16172 [Diploscapter pachys]|uniref:Protein kinase domain-containing protein n=1 Tax=Diploscapter pachys TaxID=2018661 RepID=A0A2A2KUF0_9BILA|nr:hypothetical protein WR25_16172 [Diploscapter pachys]